MNRVTKYRGRPTVINKDILYEIFKMAFNQYKHRAHRQCDYKCDKLRARDKFRNHNDLLFCGNISRRSIRRYKRIFTIALLFHNQRIYSKLCDDCKRFIDYKIENKCNSMQKSESCQKQLNYKKATDTVVKYKKQVKVEK